MVMIPRKRPGMPVATKRPTIRSVATHGGRARARITRTSGRGPAAGRGRRGLAVLMAAYLAVAFLALAVVFLAFPHSSAAPAASADRAWDYQLETVALQGGGLLNAYSRGAVHATAWLARSSIERQRDVHRLNLLEYLAGEPAAHAAGRWLGAHRLALEGATIALLIGLAGYGLLARPAGRHWLVAIGVLLALTAVATRPLSSSRLAGQAGVAVPNLVLGAAVQGDPTQELRGGTQQIQRALAGGYWTAFVAEPLSRLQTGSDVLAGAAPTGKPGVLGLLRAKIGAVNDWAVGRHGLERSVISTFAVVYVLPFALVLCALAMLASCAQALLFLLCLAGPVAVALALEPRWRRAVMRWWLLPLAAAVGLLATAALASFLVVRVAELLHGSDEYLGLLLAGSAWPLLAGALLGRRWLRHRRSTRRPRPNRRRRSARRPIVVRGGAA